MTLIDWIVTAIERTGYLGVFLLMLIDNVFPPIPSEVIMPLAGFAAARGQLSLIGVFLAGTAGSLSGALVWYGVGRWLGRERLRRFATRHGRWLTLSPAEVDRASAWFARRGGLSVLIGRVIPGVRSLISVPAGVAGMPLTPFWSTRPSARSSGPGCWLQPATGSARTTAPWSASSSPSETACWSWAWRSTSTVSPPSSAAETFGADLREKQPFAGAIEALFRARRTGGS
jgi:membrane protein YqaA with SNARE-associated domain